METVISFSDLTTSGIDIPDTEFIFVANSTTENIQSIKPSYVELHLGYVLIGAIGFISNLFVIIVLGSSPKIRQKLVNTLIIHQSVVDMLTSIALIGPTHLDGSKPHGLHGLHSDIYCYFVVTKWPLWALIDISSFSLMFLNIERYISIVYPIYHHTKVTRKKVIMFFPILWMLGLLQQVVGAFWKNGRTGICTIGTSAFQEKMKLTTIYLFLICQFFLPILLFIFLYGHMIIRVTRSKMSQRDSAGGQRDAVMDKAKKNIFKTMLLLTICYIISFVFNSFYTVLLLLGKANTLAGKFSFPISKTFVKLTMTCNRDRNESAVLFCSELSCNYYIALLPARCQ